eukprot:TRINITY_DN17235_c0_g1_i2.p1 TRINITY_DN17235_c0_g1~~TRINITY_DN17235_c0_g1_i2.p1  ORF type:complete len:541 (+),score=168.88 TRINITY_DN17235_c0_g1_i2:114-1736(+)
MGRGGGEAVAVSPSAPRFVCSYFQERAAAPLQLLSTPKLLGVLFVSCIGGAYGLEGCLRTGGPLATQLFLAVLPWVWGLPTALCVAELASALPSNAGPDMWINVTFPTWFTTMSLCWTFLINRVDNSLYPNLFVDYLDQIAEIGSVAKAVIKVGFVAVCVVLNVFGVELVGWASVALALCSVLPFALSFLWELPHMQTADWGHVPASIDWAKFLPLIAWNVSGFDSAGHIVEEVRAGAGTLVRAFVLLMLATQAVYMLPVMTGVSAQTRWARGAPNATNASGAPDYSAWRDGHFVTAAEWSGGPWLGYVTLAGGCTSALGFMAALLCTTSRALQGHAVLGLFPAPVSAWLKQVHPRRHTPVNAILVNGACALGLSLALEFGTLVDVDQVLYSFRLIAIFAACMRLRMRYPELPRPFRIPVGTAGLAAILAVPVCFCVTCIAAGAAADRNVFVIALILVCGSLLFSVPYSRYALPNGFDGRVVEGGVHEELPAQYDVELHSAESSYSCMDQAAGRALSAARLPSAGAPQCRQPSEAECGAV